MLRIAWLDLDTHGDEPSRVRSSTNSQVRHITTVAQMCLEPGSTGGYGLACLQGVLSRAPRHCCQDCMKESMSAKRNIHVLGAGYHKASPCQLRTQMYLPTPVFLHRAYSISGSQQGIPVIVSRFMVSHGVPQGRGLMVSRTKGRGYRGCQDLKVKVRA